MSIPSLDSDLSDQTSAEPDSTSNPVYSTCTVIAGGSDKSVGITHVPVTALPALEVAVVVNITGKYVPPHMRRKLIDAVPAAV